MEMRESVQAGASTSGRRLQHMKLAVVLPLTVFGLALGVVLLNRSGELTPAGEFPSDLPAPIAVAVAESDEAAAAHASVQQAVVSNATGTATKQPTMKEVMQVGERSRVWSPNSMQVSGASEALRAYS
jgi:hypothetical protein